MHEISIVENIVEIITAEIPKHGITKVESIKLVIGEMQQVVPDTLLFAFDVLSKDTPLEGAKLIIESLPIRGCCKSCLQDFIMEDWGGKCISCGEKDIEIISGKELDIVGLEGS